MFRNDWSFILTINALKGQVFSALLSLCISQTVHAHLQLERTQYLCVFVNLLTNKQTRWAQCDESAYQVGTVHAVTRMPYSLPCVMAELPFFSGELGNTSFSRWCTELTIGACVTCL